MIVTQSYSYMRREQLSLLIDFVGKLQQVLFFEGEGAFIC